MKYGYSFFLSLLNISVTVFLLRTSSSSVIIVVNEHSQYFSKKTCFVGRGVFDSWETVAKALLSSQDNRVSLFLSPNENIVGIPPWWLTRPPFWSCDRPCESLNERATGFFDKYCRAIKVTNLLQNKQLTS